MITEVTMAFLKAVKENNNVQRMNRNRDLYHMERDNFCDFAKGLIERTCEIAKNIGPLEVKDATFRFNRDIRFTKDKSPYKGNFGVIIREGGKKGDGPGYYLHIEPGESFIGGGAYQPSAQALPRMRTYLARHYRKFQKIIHDPSFKKTFGSIMGDELKKMPKGFDLHHPAERYIRMKSRYVGHNLSDREVLQDDLMEYCISIFKTMKPLNDFLYQAYRS